MKTFNEWIALREQGPGAPGSGVGGPAPTGAGGPGTIAPAQAAPGAIPQTPNQVKTAVANKAPNPMDAPDWTSPQFYMEFHKTKDLATQIGQFKAELNKYLQATHGKRLDELGGIGNPVAGKVHVTVKGSPATEEVNPHQWGEIERAGMILVGKSPDQQQTT